MATEIKVRTTGLRSVRGHLWAMVCAMLVLTGCSLGAPAATPEAKGAGGEFRVALAAEPVTLNPDLKADDAAFIIAQNLFNKVVTLDADYRIIPDLATKWEISSDGLAYTFHLAKGVKWHDGKPLTSADVKWTLERIAAGTGPSKALAEHIVRMDTPNALTIVMRLNEPWSPFLPTLAWYGTFILPKHSYTDGDWSTQAANDQAVGTGPFQFVEWVKGDRIVLSANPAYFRRGPLMSRIVFRFFKDANTAADLVVKGELDFTLARPAFDRIPGLAETPGITVMTFPHPARYYFGFNLLREPLKDVRVRKAINMAIDRPALVQKALFGYGAAGVGFYTPAVQWAFNPDAKAPSLDLDGANALLDQVGLVRGNGGIRIKLTLVTLAQSPFKDLASVLAEQLKAVGIQLDLGLVTTEWNQRVFVDKDFDLALTNGSQGPDPDNMALRFASKGGNQFMGYASAAFDAAVAEGARATVLADRAKAYMKAQEILAADLPFAPLAEYAQVLIFRQGVTGIPQVEARGLVTFNDFSLVRR